MRPRVALLAATAGRRRDGPAIAPAGYVRVALPYTQPALLGWFDPGVTAGGPLPAVGSADLAVLQRDLPEPLRDGFAAWHRDFRNAGGRLVYELDDDLLDGDALRLRSAPRDAGALADRVRAYAAAADLVTVSTPTLAGRLADHAAKVRVVPNALDARLWRTGEPGGALRPRPGPSGPVRIGYMGTATHGADLALVSEAMRAIETRFAGRAAIEVAGAFERAEPLFGARIALPADARYPAFVRWIRAAADWDIAIIPLVDDGFNRAKSDLKFLESAALGAAIVCSDVPTYRDVARDGHNCLCVANDTGAWIAALERLIADAGLRRRLAGAAHREVAARRTVQGQAGLYRDVLDAALGATA